MLITENTSKPKQLKINPTTETAKIVRTDGNNTANDLDTFGGTLSGSLHVSFPDWVNLT